MWARLPKPGAIADACGRALRRSLPAAAAVAAACAVGGGLWAGHRFLTTSPRFAITDIAITGAHRIEEAALRAALPVHRGDNVFVSTQAIARAARQAPGAAWIASIDVRRVLPHTLAIELREHEPAAVVEAGEPYLVDADGRPFKRLAEADDADGLPRITGLERQAFTADPEAARRAVRDAIEAHQRWAAADRPPIQAVALDPRGALTLRVAPQLAIQLGTPGDGLAARIQTFDAAWASLSAAERARARAIHLDARADHVTVALAPVAGAERAGQKDPK